jgi:hypothetical protein
MTSFDVQERLERIITDATVDQSFLPMPVFHRPAPVEAEATQYDHKVWDRPHF